MGEGTPAGTDVSLPCLPPVSPKPPDLSKLSVGVEVPPAWRPAYVSGTADWEVGVLPGPQVRCLAMPLLCLLMPPAAHSNAMSCHAWSALPQTVCVILPSSSISQADPDYFTPEDIQTLLSTAYKVGWAGAC